MIYAETLSFILNIQLSLIIANICFSLICLFFLYKLSKQFSQYIPLAIFVLLGTFTNVDALYFNQELYKDFPNIIYLLEPFHLLNGILIYLYARSQSQQVFRLSKKDWVLIVPFLLSLFTYLPFYFTEGSEKLANFLSYGNLKTELNENTWEWIFESFVNFYFLYLALKELKEYRANLKEQVSDTHNTDLNLTTFLIKLVMSIYIFEALFVYSSLYGFPYYKSLYSMLGVLENVILLFLVYDAVRSYRNIGNLNPEMLNLLQPNEIQNLYKNKYQKSSLTDESSQTIKDKLLECMKSEKLYLTPQLRIRDVSEQLDIPSHQISQVINESFQQNFYEFVNSFRIDEAKRILKDSKFENYTYTAIGFEVGFNSKSAFYTAFKKYCACTPAQYRGN